MILRKLRQIQPELTVICYQRMIGLEKKFKASEDELESYYRSVLSNTLISFQETWKICNGWLPEDEQLSLPSEEKSYLSKKGTLHFSNEQVVILANLMADCLKPSFRWKLFYRMLRQHLGKGKKWLSDLFNG